MSYVSEKRDVEFADFTHGAGNISGNCAVGNGRGKATTTAPPPPPPLPSPSPPHHHRQQHPREYRCDTFSPRRCRCQSNAVPCRIRTIHECITVLLSRYSCLFRRLCVNIKLYRVLNIYAKNRFSPSLGNE